MIKSDAIKVFFIIFSACILRVFFDFINDIEIHYEEAQYWVWSQNPSLSYLTKGPFIAQAIALSEWIFGHSYLGLKFLSFVSYGGTAIIIGVCSYLISKEKTAFYLGVLFTLSSPAIFALGGIASTDIYLFLFWSVCLLGYIKFLETKDEKWFYLIAIGIGFGTLTKLSIILFPLSVLIYFSLSEFRTYFGSATLYKSMLVAFFLGLPILIWNYQNNWVTVQHEVGHLVSDNPTTNPEVLFFAFLITIPSALLVLNKSFYQFMQGKLVRSILIPTLFVLIFFLFKSIAGKIQLNWSIPLFITLIPIVSAFLSKIKFKYFILNFSGVMLLFIFSNLSFTTNFTPNDPMHALRGWKLEIKKLFKDQSYDMIVSNDYKLLSISAYYLNDSQNLFLDSSKNTRLTYYDIWDKKINKGDLILYISYSNKPILDQALDCNSFNSVNNNSRKQLTLYTCKKL
tara:strand:+ start:325 stop:1689 length:1365 start_codon:yes stop_codon:yes gene_type:complete